MEIRSLVQLISLLADSLTVPPLINPVSNPSLRQSQVCWSPMLAKPPQPRAYRETRNLEFSLAQWAQFLLLSTPLRLFFVE